MTVKRMIAGLAPATLLLLLLTACGGDAPPPPPSGAAPEATDATPAPASDDPIETAVEAMTEAAYRRHIETLASDAFGGRAPATPGEDLTVTYLIPLFAIAWGAVFLDEPGGGREADMYVRMGNSTRKLPAAEVEKLIVSRSPENASGLVINSPPS